MMDTKTDDGNEIVQRIALELIDPHPLNRAISASSAAEMAEMLAERGQVTPAIVRPMPEGRYQIIAGERRWRGCSIAGIPTLMCLAREMGDNEAAETLLLDNLNRQDLSEMEEAHGYDELLKLRDESGARIYTLEEIAIKVWSNPKAVQRVARVHKLLLLPAATQKALEEGDIKLRVAFLVARIADADLREKAGKDVLADRYTGKPMTVKQAEQHISEHYQNNVRSPAFDRADETLVDVIVDRNGERVAGGSCEDCPSLARNNKAFSGDLQSGSGTSKGKGESGIDPMTCISPDCFHRKLEAMWQRVTRPILLAETGVRHVPLKESRHWFPYAPEMRVNMNAPVIGLDEEPDYVGGEKVNLPKWSKLLKGSGIARQVACGPAMKPVMVADKKLAIAWLESTKPELFASEGKGAGANLDAEEIAALKAEAAASGALMSTLVERAQKRKAAEEKRKAEKDKLVESEAKRDTMLELVEVIARKGLGLDAWRTLWAAALTHVDEWEALQAFLGIEEQRDYVKNQTAIEEHVENLPPAQIAALTAMALVWDDWLACGEKAEHLAELAEIYKVSHTETRKRVRKAHEIAEKQRIKAEADKEKAASMKGRKNSSDPSNWTPEGEASKTAAADAQGKTRRPGDNETGREELFTCPKCGTANFTAKGLKSHNCKKRQQVASKEQTTFADQVAMAKAKKPWAQIIGEEPVKGTPRHAKWTALRINIYKAAKK